MARLLVGVVVGLLFGLVMSVVSNLFVITVKAATGLREGSVADLLAIGDSGLTLAPLVCLVAAALIVVFIRTSLGIGRWHGPADSIHAAHRTDNELDIRAGFGSTLAALVSPEAAHLSASTGRLSISARRWERARRLPDAS